LSLSIPTTELTLGTLVVVALIHVPLCPSHVGIVVVVNFPTDIGLVVGVWSVGIVEATVLVSGGVCVSVGIGIGHVGEVGLGGRHGDG
jgi:hypothetical protein